MKQQHDELIQDAKDWILDCYWQEQEEIENWLEDATDDEIIQKINQHYAGGWYQFKFDGQ